MKNKIVTFAGTGNHYGKQNNIDVEIQMPHVLNYMYNLDLNLFVQVMKIE